MYQCPSCRGLMMVFAQSGYFGRWDMGKLLGAIPYASRQKMEGVPDPAEEDRQEGWNPSIPIGRQSDFHRPQLQGARAGRRGPEHQYAMDAPICDGATRTSWNDSRHTGSLTASGGSRVGPSMVVAAVSATNADTRGRGSIRATPIRC